MKVHSAKSVLVETVSIVEFRRELKAFVDQVKWRGKVVVIERNGEPVARLVPIDEPKKKRGA